MNCRLQSLLDHVSPTLDYIHTHNTALYKCSILIINIIIIIIISTTNTQTYELDQLHMKLNLVSRSILREVARSTAMIITVDV